jgi:hypothetical protein
LVLFVAVGRSIFKSPTSENSTLPLLNTPSVSLTSPSLPAVVPRPPPPFSYPPPTYSFIGCSVFILPSPERCPIQSKKRLVRARRVQELHQILKSNNTMFPPLQNQKRGSESTRISVMMRKRLPVCLDLQFATLILSGAHFWFLLTCRCKGGHVSGNANVAWYTNQCSPYVALQIELKAEDLYDKEKVDLETVVIEDVFKLLQATEEGLTTEVAEERVVLFGPNKLESEEQNAFLQVCLPLYFL